MSSENISNPQPKKEKFPRKCSGPCKEMREEEFYKKIGENGRYKRICNVCLENSSKSETTSNERNAKTPTRIRMNVTTLHKDNQEILLELRSFIEEYKKDKASRLLETQTLAQALKAIMGKFEDTNEKIQELSKDYTQYDDIKQNNIEPIEKNDNISEISGESIGTISPKGLMIHKAIELLTSPEHRSISPTKPGRKFVYLTEEQIKKIDEYNLNQRIENVSRLINKLQKINVRSKEQEEDLTMKLLYRDQLIKEREIRIAVHQRIKSTSSPKLNKSKERINL
jgi:hypothetical protein